jgi:hypothetical protein
MPFNLPDLEWTTWLYIALAGGVIALLCSHFSNERRGLGFVAFLATIVAAFCGVVGFVQWMKR